MTDNCVALRLIEDIRRSNELAFDNVMVCSFRVMIYTSMFVPQGLTHHYRILIA